MTIKQLLEQAEKALLVITGEKEGFTVVRYASHSMSMPINDDLQSFLADQIRQAVKVAFEEVRQELVNTSTIGKHTIEVFDDRQAKYLNENVWEN